jgi:hypothetical protein
LPQARWDAAAAPDGPREPAVAAAELPEAVRPAVAAEPRAAEVAEPFAAMAEVAGRRVAAAVQVSEAPLCAEAVLHAALEPLTLRRVPRVVSEARTLRPGQSAVEARQPLGRFGMTVPAFGLAAEFAASVAELQCRVLVQPLARL